MPERQFTTPLMIEGGEAVSLERVPLGEKSYTESWLRETLQKHPSLLPVAEIEPIFDGLVPLARELQTKCGLIDLLFVNPDGMLTIVETKLWRNPEARRKVVAQIIDYAKDLAKWTYSDLVKAVKAATGSSEPDPVASLACENGDESQFMDRVSRNLRLGRFLLLIVGDGIHEGVEEIADFLQQTPSLGFTLSLVEMALFRKGEGRQAPLFVQPRVLARTVEMERAIVTLRIPVSPGDIEITTPAIAPASDGRRRNPTAAEFYETLRAAAGPEAVAFVEWALQEGQTLGLKVEWKGTGPFLKYQDEESGNWRTVASFRKGGRLAGGKTGPPREALYRYFDELARFVPGASRRLGDSPSARKWGGEELLMEDGQEVPLVVLDQHRDQWLAALKKLLASLEKQDDGA
jgi:hypothetical protein